MKKGFFKLVVASAATLVFTVSAANAGFNDVSSSHKYLDSIGLITDRAIVQGYEDGSYKPDNYINRAEFVKIITLSSGIHDESKNYNCFNDVPAGQWFTSYICSAKEAGLVIGFPDGSFGPGKQINFVEALKIVERGMGVQYVENTTPWFRGMVNTASARNLIPLSIDSFDKKLTRGEMADMIARFLLNREGKLDNFLKERVNFRVTYDNLENGLSIEREWLFYLDSLSNNIYSPLDFDENIALPVPSKGRVLNGDGEYEVTGGDQVHLNNGIVVEVSSISRPANEGYFIFLNYYINNERINFLPVPIGQVKEDYGSRVEVNTLRRADSDPRYFTMKFSSNGNFSSNEDLFKNCINSASEEVNCYKYSVFEPMPGESIKTDGVYRIIYPAAEEEFATYFLGQMKSCIPELIKESGLAPKIGIVPLRLYYSESRAVITNHSGIFWPITIEDRKAIVKGPVGCYDPVVVHELTHFLILPAFMDEVINEGLAYYMEKEVIDNLFDEKTRLVSSSKRLTSNQSFTDSETNIKITFLGGSKDYENIAVFEFEDLLGRFEKKQAGVAVNTGISTDNYVVLTNNTVLELTHLNRGVPFEATFNLYNSPPSREFLHCNENGYNNEFGWRTADGKFVELFNFSRYDTETNVQSGIGGTYRPLNNYLKGDTPWIDTYEDFYSTGACMWREHEKNDPQAVKKAFEIVNEFRSMVSAKRNDFALALFEKLGPTFEAIARKRGIDI